MKKGNAKKSIADSLTRIIKYNYKDIAEDQIIVARVVSVNSDILVPDTFGTMDCYDEKNQIDIFEVPLNAHINDDGTTGISGKYTFPKVGSDIFLVADIRANKEVFIPILFSHIDSVFEQYNTGKTTKIVGVNTADENKPYDTEDTDDYLEIVQTKESDISTILSTTNSGNSIRSQEYDSISDYVGSSSGSTSRSLQVNNIVDDIQGSGGNSKHQQTNVKVSDSVSSTSGSSTLIEQNGSDIVMSSTSPSTGDSSNIEIDSSEINISSGVVGVTPEPAVMGNTIKTLLEELIIEVIAVNSAIPSMAASPTAVTNLPIISGKLSTMLNTKIKLS